MFIKRSRYDVLVNQLEFYKKLNEEKSRELYNAKMLLEHYIRGIYPYKVFWHYVLKHRSHHPEKIYKRTK